MLTKHQTCVKYRTRGVSPRGRWQGALAGLAVTTPRSETLRVQYFTALLAHKTLNAALASTVPAASRRVALANGKSV